VEEIAWEGMSGFPEATMLIGGTFVTPEKGGFGTNAIGGSHDERRFGQLALRLNL
jgi:hypothetical protein